MRAIESSLVLINACDRVSPTFKELEELEEVDTLVAVTSV
jgi:hypothetical protein